MWAIFAGPPDIEEIKRRLKEKPYKPEPHKEGDDPWSYTRLLTVDYAFETETVMYDMLKNKVKSPSTIIAGNFSFDSLHHDLEGGMLAKYKLTACTTGNCGDVPDVYVAFIQGGNNIKEVLYDPTQFPGQEPRWNFLYGIINTLYTPAENGEGDEQIVDTVYGRCKVHFKRPEDKRFQRTINNCEIKADLNFTRMGGLQPVHYEQDATYIQNMKIDADIVIIEAVEMLTFRSPFDKKWGFSLESRTHVEIRNRTMHYVKKHCDANNQTAAVCAAQKFGAVPVGEKLYHKVLLGQKNKKNEIIDGELQLAKAVNDYRTHLYEMGDSHTCEKHSSMFARIVQEARHASEAEWRAVIMQPENEPVLHVLANVLGTLGNSESLKIAREVLLEQGPDFLEDYLFGAAHTTSHDEKWHKQMMYWLAEVKGDKSKRFWKIANTIATILRRRCERTPSSQNACKLGKERVGELMQIVVKFITDISDCKRDRCYVKALEVLRNIPIAMSYEIARGLLCSNHSQAVQMAALQVIKAAHPSLYDTKLTHVLIKLFRNTCPTPTSTGESQLAVDILLNCVPEQQNVATLLLRTETVHPDDHEKWNYFYKAVESSGLQDELKEEFWRRMRKFKVFRPNYAQRAVIADSNRDWREIAEFAGYKLHATSSVEFDSGMFRRSDFDIRVKRGKEDLSLFGVTINTQALDSFIREQTTPADPEADVRISFLNHALPVKTIFEGSTEMMGAAWNADGQTVKVLEGNAMLRETSVSLPLLSGLTVEVESAGAVSLKLLTASTVSLWNQHSTSDFSANMSLSLDTHATLIHHGEVVHKLSSTMGAVATVGGDVEVAFSSMPFDVCIRMHRGDVHASFEMIDEATKKPRKKRTVTRTRRYPGVTFKLNDRITQQCNMLASNTK
ncbi:hypothetical protein ANCCEY_06977 [Ancylostoma ceylanicum]|uniref:MTP large subunit lipid-binding domain-containing protein n=1 Tax=Ancylostoma ceylanicum TaxID=53326 RepID=A0A0D6LPD0_9BILA|nr:hypothetical protein ANCCEY_06977 [Ancylostoma ceylanicum]